MNERTHNEIELRDQHFQQHVERIQLEIGRMFDPVSPVVAAVRRLRARIANDIGQLRRHDDAA
jgi:hypothetical protein